MDVRTRNPARQINFVRGRSRAARALSSVDQRLSQLLSQLGSSAHGIKGNQAILSTLVKMYISFEKKTFHKFFPDDIKNYEPPKEFLVP